MEGNNHERKNAIGIQLQKYWDNNIKLRDKMQFLKDTLILLSEKDKVSSKDLIEKNGVFSKSDETLKQLYDEVLPYSEKLITVISELIENLDQEKVETQRFFETLNPDEIHSLKEFERICVNYNSKERSLLNTVYQSFSVVEDLENRLLNYGITLDENNKQYFSQAAKEFTSYFIELYKALQSLESKEYLFRSLVLLLTYLKKYEQQSASLHQGWKEGFLAAVHDIEISNELLSSKGIKVDKVLNRTKNRVNKSRNIFLSNFFDNGLAKGNEVIAQMGSFTSKTISEDGERLEKTYGDLNSDDKLDKSLSTWLKDLFKGSQFLIESDILKIDDVVKKIIKEKTDIKKLKGTFAKQIEQIIEIIKIDKKVELTTLAGNNYHNLQIEVSGKSGLFSFGDLLNDKFENSFVKLQDSIGEGITSYLEKIILDGNGKKKDAYVSFVKLNEKYLSSSVSSSDDSDDDWDGAKEVKENEVEHLFDEVILNIQNHISVIEHIIFEGDDIYNLKTKLNPQEISSISDSLRSGTNNCKKMLQSLGKNLVLFKNIKKSSLEPVIDSVKGDIKNLIKLIDKSINQPSQVKIIIDKLKEILRQIGE